MMIELQDISDLAQTQHWANTLSALYQQGDIITLTGDLGTGKTTFVQQCCIALGLDHHEVSSPTFGLVHVYDFIPPLWHFDLYRLNHPHDLYELGLDEAFEQGITLIEWPETAHAFLPESRLDLHFTWCTTSQRFLGLTPRGLWIEKLKHAGIHV